MLPPLPGPDDGILGQERLASFVASCRGLSADATAGRLERAVLDAQDGAMRDDVAFLVLRLPEADG